MEHGIRRTLSAILATAILGSWLVAAPSNVTAAAAAPGPDDTPGVTGQWSALEDWPLIAIHAALDTQGRVLTYGTNGDGQQTGRFIYDVWSPEGSAAEGHTTLANTTQTDLFCSLQLNRPDTGTMLLFGGDQWNGNSTINVGSADINEYDPTNRQINQLPGMARQRWYGTGTTRPDGSIYVQGGDLGADRPELWTAENGSQLLDLDTSALNWWYPRNFVLPDGRIFGVDTIGQMYYISADLGTLTMAGRLAPDRWGFGTTAVMYQPGRILHFGGESATAVIIDANGPNPVVTPTAPLSAAREWVNSTILPDGRVLATGGASRFTAASEAGQPLADYGVVNSAELWDPATGTWTVQTSGQAARLYHSTALLLPDGRVLVAGGGAPGPVANTNAEIFSPDYLSTAGGNPTDRPTIISVSSTDAAPGETLSLQVDSPDVAIARVTLTKVGSVTHSINMGQRFSELPFVLDGDSIRAKLPLNSAEVTPGHYLLTVLTAEGVPSTSTMIRIDPGPVVPGLVGSPDATIEGQISRLYLAYFRRMPDGGGLAYWFNQLTNGVPLVAVSAAFAESAEFVNTYGALDDGAFVDLVYANVLGRPADAEGRAWWTQALAGGASRGSIMLGFSESAEFINLTGTGQALPPPVVPGPAPVPVPIPPAPAPVDPELPVAEAHRAEIRRLYLAYFVRDPEAEGLSYWTQTRAAGVPLVTVSAALAESPEFVNTYGALDDGAFVDLVYANVLGRPADPEGRAWWTQALAGGASRGSIMLGFSESAEFINLTDPG